MALRSEDEIERELSLYARRDHWGHNPVFTHADICKSLISVLSWVLGNERDFSKKPYSYYDDIVKQYNEKHNNKIDEKI